MLIAWEYVQARPVLTPTEVGQRTDADLAREIQGSLAGEARKSEGELFRRFAPRVRLYGLRHLRSESLAEDLVQQTMEITIAKLRRREILEPDRIASFILGCARMVASNLRRDRTRKMDSLDDSHAQTLVAEEPPPSSTYSVPRLAEALTALTERERTIITLSFYGEQSASEIGEALGLSPGNVRVIRHRAVARLRSLMGAEGSHDDEAM